MSGPRKRRHEEDFTASDPEDETYGRPSPRKKKPNAASTSSVRLSKKPRRTGYVRDDEEDDIDDDDDDEEIEYDSDSENSSHRDLQDVGIGSRRRRTQKPTTYKEPDSDEEFEGNPARGDRGESDEASSESSQGKQTLIVKLKVHPRQVSGASNSRVASNSSRQNSSPEPSGVRRSRRLSRDEPEDTVDLTKFGRYQQAVRSGTRSPDPPSVRPMRGGKGLKGPRTSIIIEASQEESLPSKQASLQYGLDEDALELQEQVDEGQGKDQSAKGAVVAESIHENDDMDDDDDDDDPVATHRRTRLAQSSHRANAADDDGSDFEPELAADEPDEAGDSSSSADSKSPRKGSRRMESETSSPRRSGKRKAIVESDDDSEIDAEELAEEAAELAATRRRKSRTKHILYEAAPPRLRSRGNKPDYRIYRPELVAPIDDDDQAPNPSPSRGARRGGGYRSLFSTLGPFGGAGGPIPVFGSAVTAGAAGGADTDSSDDDMISKSPKNIGGTVGMTPTGLVPHGILPQLGPDQGQTTSGPANFGKVKDRKALADADPLGIDPNVSFEGVGGLDGHINQLKEMVALPLLYPEVFQRFHVTPPRGVLFHGPPGTGKTLLARALASSVSSQGRKVTFYMRKGADALSKWVGEAERQLRLLFEEARKNQPSIIFFDEIDGLAPVRSSKQEQIHASIVATLLALMDGMDGRGQVIVIGATNRPDSVDPALRRPGRFDREFYFPLPNKQARRAILGIHTKGWNPPLKPDFLDQLAGLTQGYGGADLRALCTEAALNAVQGTYPQIYQSNEKLIIDPSQIKVLAKDFMISVDKMIPSSERSGTSGAAVLEKGVEPLLREALARASRLLDEAMPERKKLTALEEAEFDDRDDHAGFDREIMQQDFDKRRIYRPRLLIHGLQGMGQQYLGAALLSKYERLHVQSFDLSTIFGDSARSPEAAVVQLFNEVRRHKPSVIYIPNANNWYRTVGKSVTRLLSGLLRSLPPNDPVLVLGIMEMESDKDQPDREMLREIFGFTPQNQFTLGRPHEPARREFFDGIIAYISSQPTQFPDGDHRKKRALVALPVAPAPSMPEGPSKDDLKAQKKQDRHTLNLLKMYIQPIMDQLRNKYKKFRTPIVDEGRIGYLFEEQMPDVLTTDLPLEDRQKHTYRPYELVNDDKGVPGLLEVATDKFYYNLELVTIEKRLSNGYYKRPKDFLADIKRLAKDARTSGDPERILKANEILTNVEVDMQLIFEVNNVALTAACEQVYAREQRRAQERLKSQGAEAHVASYLGAEVPSTATGQSSGPVILGEPVPGRQTIPVVLPLHPSDTSQMTNGYSNSNTHHTSNSSIEQGSDELEDGDVPMSNGEGTQGSRQLPAVSTQRSQVSAMTPMAQDSQPADYHNSASTTTSGQKTSDKSNPPSGPNADSHSTNGVLSDDAPNFSILHGQRGGSQLPDTQEMADSNDGYHNNSPAATIGHLRVVPEMPPPDVPRIPSIESVFNTPEHPQLKLDERKLHKLHEQLVALTSGCSVEQLEQIYAALMDAVWQSRHLWDRDEVMVKVTTAFNQVIKDIEEIQRILPPSQEDDSIG